MKSQTHSWVVFYFSISVVIFALAFTVSIMGAYSPDENALAVISIIGIFLLLSLIPLFIILMGKKTPRNWKRLLGWIIVESIYNPLFGIPLWIAWTRKNNKARFGDEMAFKREAAETQARRKAARENTRKLATQLVAANAALDVYKKLSPEQKKNAMRAGLYIGALAALNPDKAKQAKNAISNLGKSKSSSVGTGNALERIQELNKLYENKLISRQEYESKKSEILSSL